jgi:hypothetical protein
MARVWVQGLAMARTDPAEAATTAEAMSEDNRRTGTNSDEIEEVARILRTSITPFEGGQLAHINRPHDRTNLKTIITGMDASHRRLVRVTLGLLVG